MNTRGVSVGLVLATVVAAVGVGGCEDKPNPNAAPTSAPLSSAAPATDAAVKATVVTDSSKAEFKMDAALEIIYGDAPKSVSGELFVDLTDLTKSTGLVKVDLMQLTLHQEKRESEDGEFGDKETVAKQNDHMKAWFEISPDAPEEEREKNRYVEFKIEKIENVENKDVSKMSGDERKVTADVTGTLRLHQRPETKTVKLELTFKYEGDKAKSVSVKTLEPVMVSLDKHDVRPREAFGKLAEATLETVGKKVAGEAPVNIEFTADL